MEKWEGRMWEGVLHLNHINRFFIKRIVSDLDSDWLGDVLKLLHTCERVILILCIDALSTSEHPSLCCTATLLLSQRRFMICS